MPSRPAPIVIRAILRHLYTNGGWSPVVSLDGSQSITDAVRVENPAITERVMRNTLQSMHRHGTVERRRNLKNEFGLGGNTMLYRITDAGIMALADWSAEIPEDGPTDEQRDRAAETTFEAKYGDCAI